MTSGFMASWLMVAFGGALGAMARYGLALWLQPVAGKFPVATLVANISGCFLIGLLYVVMVNKAFIPLTWRPFLVIGILGAFTTFSTFSLETLALWQQQYHAIAGLYIALSVSGSLFAVWLGFTFAEFLFSQ